MAKTAARSDPSKKEKKKKKGKGAKRLPSGPAAAAMKAAKPPHTLNPFETIWSRRKFDVVGKRRKGEERRIGLSRSLAVEKRKKTLLKEYEQSAKSSVFLDNRIGEKDDTLQEFNKAVLRLQRERQLKLKRTSKYNLSDDEEDDTTVDQPHSSDKDDFEDEVPLDDDEDADFKNGSGLASPKHLSLQSLQNSSESSLLDGEDQTHKSKKQVMMEIISKSKFYKAQKVKEKEEDESLMAKLDEDFSMLAQTEALQALSHPSKMNALKALLNKDIKRESLKEGSSGLSDNKLIEKGHPDAYDKLVKELGSDRRAHASDRTKTPEEIAQEEKERLEELEKQRRERMLATDDSTDEGSDDDNVEIQNSASIKIRPTSGDDLGDSFSIADDVTGKKGWIDGIYEQNDADNQDESDSSSQDSEGDEDNEGDGDGKDGSGDEHVNISTMKDWEQSDDDDDGLNMDSEETENIDEKEVAIGDKLSLDLHEVKTSSSHEMNAAGNLAPAKEKELPYVIEAPKNLTELCSLLDSRSDDEVVEIINRIRAYNSIRLAAENRKKMQIFYGVLLQYFAVLATQSPLNFKIINSLVKPLVEMSAETPYFAAICARQRLIHIRTHFLEDIKNPGKSCWPTLKTLLLLRLWSLVFPCSDFRHVVMTPALLLMCEYLMRCPINSGQDAARGSFLCSLVFSVCKQSQKFCPEAIIYLQTLLTSSIELKLGLQQHSQLNHLMEIRVLKPWLHITDQTCAIHPLDFFAVMEMQEESPFFATDTFRASVLSSVSETLKGFIIIYEGFSSFAEIFSPISNLLHEVLQNPNLPGLLRDKMQDVLDLIKKKTDEHHMFRKPLQMRKQKPVPIKLLNPKFEENFVKGRDYDPDRERAEMKKLKKLLKSEKKGAIRELRKDSQFVSGLKETGRLMQEEERAEKYGKAMAFLQEQEYAFKSGQLGKGRKRRR
ncbi:unnamed protein product [Musa acuminata subsp. burmannicoides]